jgi:lysophospholipase L1-like esterase
MSEHPRRRLPWAVPAAGVVLAVALGLILTLAVPRPASSAVAGAQRPAAATSEHRTPVVAFLGDSWTVGYGSGGGTHDFHGYVERTAAILGWRSLDFGVGGSGYTHPGSDKSVYAQRIAAVVAAHPDVIVVQGSLNDSPSTPAAEASAAYTTLHLLRAEADPGTPILVVGASYAPGKPNATIDWINAAIRRAAERVGLAFVNPAQLNWSDPHDPTIWFNPIHVNDHGAQLIAEHLAPLIRPLVRR